MIPEKVNTVLEQHGLAALEYEPGSTPTAEMAAARVGVYLGVRLVDAGHEVTFPLPRGRGTYAAVARRNDLDAALVERARSAGAKVLDGHACTGVSARPDDVTATVDGVGDVDRRRGKRRPIDRLDR